MCPPHRQDNYKTDTHFVGYLCVWRSSSMSNSLFSSWNVKTLHLSSSLSQRPPSLSGLTLPYAWPHCWSWPPVKLPSLRPSHSGVQYITPVVILLLSAMQAARTVTDLWGLQLGWSSPLLSVILAPPLLYLWCICRIMCCMLLTEDEV